MGRMDPPAVDTPRSGSSREERPREVPDPAREVPDPARVLEVGPGHLGGGEAAMFRTIRGT